MSKPSSRSVSRRSRTGVQLDTLVVHYAELGTKGKNRGFFEHILRRNLERALAGTGVMKVSNAFGRITAYFPPGAPRPLEARPIPATGAPISADAHRIPAAAPVDLDEQVEDAARRAAKVLGVAYIGTGIQVGGKGLEAIEDAALRLLNSAPEGSFRVTARRAMSEFKMSSQEINRELGAALVAGTGRAVKLKDPRVTVHVEMYGSGGVVYILRLEGPGGLPAGTSGRVLALLSGGIDSPVAAWRMARRGAEVELLHFHGQPFTDPSSVRQARDLAAALSIFPPGIRLHVVPLGHAQREIATACSPELRMILYRRMMMKIAEQLATELEALAIVTGDSLGQVASQTLTNLSVVDDSTSLQVIRPLVGMTKDEIIATAREIATFEIAIRRHQDCCVLFEPRSPTTKASLDQVRRAEEGLDLATLTEKALADRETFTF